jgi:hypothetical protein
VRAFNRVRAEVGQDEMHPADLAVRHVAKFDVVEKIAARRCRRDVGRIPAAAGGQFRAAVRLNVIADGDVQQLRQQIRDAQCGAAFRRAVAIHPAGVVEIAPFHRHADRRRRVRPGVRVVVADGGIPKLQERHANAHLRGRLGDGVFFDLDLEGGARAGELRRERAAERHERACGDRGDPRERSTDPEARPDVTGRGERALPADEEIRVTGRVHADHGVHGGIAEDQRTHRATT